MRPATPIDLPSVADVFSRTRAAASPAMPAPLHTPEEDRAWVAGWDLAAWEVWVAEAAGEVVGFAVVADDWLHSLYVAPEASRRGVGGVLLDVVKGLRPEGFSLWVFESNALARDFYLRRGLVELERTDGAGNEERAPDVRMAWPGAEPLDFLRRLIDEVDDQLGDLLARRVALTRAVQGYKQDPSRDPDREAEIVARMAQRVTDLGPDRLGRIMHTVITESLDAATDGSPRGSAQNAETTK